MSKKLYANGNTGAVSISDGDANTVSPLTNLNKIYFHSDLSYLAVSSIKTGTLSLASRTASSSDASSAYGSTVHNLGAHGLSFKPMLFGYLSSGEQPILGDVVVQASGNASIRTVTLGTDATNIYAREIYLNKDVSFAALSLAYKIIILNNAGL
jgi:hypothetical protein